MVAELVTGCPPTEVAQRYDLPMQTVHQWKAEAITEFVRIEDTRARSREAMAELIYDTITDGLNALRVQLQVAADAEWLKKQTGGDFAAIMGATADRNIRLLAGLRPGESRDQRAIESGQPALDAESG